MFANEVVEALNAKFDKYVFEVAGGRKYIKVTHCPVDNNGNPYAHNSSVYMFIDAATGGFLKAASWNAPAKGVRYAPKDATEAVSIIENIADPYGGWLYARR